MRRAFLVLVVACLAAGLMVSSVNANSAPPPAVVWLYFDFPGQQANTADLPFAALQILGCEDLACESPALLQQVGSCSLPGCLAGEPLPPASGPLDWSRLECFGARCRSQSYTYPRPYFRLLVQPVEGQALLLSPVEKLPVSFAENQYWRVTAENDRLLLAPSEPLETPSAFRQPFVGRYLLTLASELGVAVLFWLWRLRRRISLPKLLWMVGLATSLTYPAVYLSPALVPFAHTSERTLFQTALAGGLFAAFLLWVLFAGALQSGVQQEGARLSRGWRIFTGLASMILLLTSILVCPLFLFSVSYGANYQIAAAGIPALAAIGLAELYAFVLEALCYRFWSRAAVNWLDALLLSLMANLVSLALGMLV